MASHGDCFAAGVRCTFTHTPAVLSVKSNVQQATQDEMDDNGCVRLPPKSVMHFAAS